MPIQTLPQVLEPDYRSPSAMAEKFAVLALAFMVGTGGFSDIRYLQQRREQGYAIAGVQGLNVENPALPRTPAQNLARIREVLKPAVSDLAAVFGVSRQAIYNWCNGEQPKADFTSRLDDIARAADVIAAENIGNSAQFLKRKISEGKTLLDVAASGGSARDAAQKLAAVLRRESEQRRALEARLAGRKREASDIGDSGLPMLDERT